MTRKMDGGLLPGYLRLRRREVHQRPSLGLRFALVTICHQLPLSLGAGGSQTPGAGWVIETFLRLVGTLTRMITNWHELRGVELRLAVGSA